MHVDNIIVGAGPIGIELAANFARLGLSWIHFEQGSLADTIYRWPKNTPFFSSPERVAIAGIPLHSTHQSMLTGEEYMAYLRGVVEYFDLDIRLEHRVISARRGKNEEAAFVLRGEHRGRREAYSCNKLFLVHGNMHEHRRLGIPGEDLPHVDHYHDDVHRYFRSRLLIVGARNSGVEAAIRAWRAGAEVTLLQRKPALEEKRLNSRYFLEISILIRKKKITFIPGAELCEITRNGVKYRQNRIDPASAAKADIAHSEESRSPHSLSPHKTEAAVQERMADFVLLCTGFEKDISLLRELGVELDDELRPNLNPQTMETNVPGLYLAGTAAGGGVRSYRIFVGTSHVHVERIIRAACSAKAVVGGYAPRVYPFNYHDLEPVEGKAEYD